MMLTQLKIEQVEPMHAQRLCKRYMQTARIIDFETAAAEIRRKREAHARLMARLEK